MNTTMLMPEPEEQQPEPTTIEAIQEIVSKSTNRHDLSAWEDGSITIQYYLYQDEQDNHMDHCRLNVNEGRALRNFLNSEPVMQTLGLL